MQKHGIFLRIEPELDEQLSRYCREHGYKKGGLIAKLIRDFLQSQSAGNDAIQEAEEFGIDLSLNAIALKMSPTERLRKLEAVHRFTSELREAGERARAKNDTIRRDS